MITRSNTSKTRAIAFRAALLACVAFIPAPAFAQGKDTANVYFVRANHEYSDGHETLSTSRDIVVARARRGDRSMTLQDFQGGAITLESSNETIANALANPKHFDALSTYDYSEVRASGTGPEVAVFNTYLRPLIVQNPVPAANQGNWSATTTLAALGLTAQGPESPVRIDLHREPLTHNGQDLVLIEFAVPAFTYRLAGGETVTHWARGIAVTDKDFAIIHIAATQHRATAIGADGTMRPFAVRTSMHGIAADGRMELRLEDLPQVAAAVRRLNETRGDDLLPLSEDLKAETFPSEVAARLDLASFAIGEGGGNPLPITTAPTYQHPADALPQGTQQSLAAFRNDAQQYLLSRGMPAADADRLLTALLRPDYTVDDYDRKEELESYFINFLQMAPSYEETQQPGYKPDPTLVQLSDLYRQSDNNIVIEMRLEGARNRAEEQWLAAGKSLDDPEYQAAAAEMLAKHRALINKRYEYLIQGLRLTDTPAGADLVNELVPGWINDPSNPDASEDIELFMMLREEMRLELEEAEAIMRQLAEEREREKTVYDDTDDFFRNNAFTYTSMVGIVATDLSKWGEWLATQDIRKLERLAKLAGYPNLASALTDAQNILRQSQDPGYRQWAMQAPSCSGLAGCGPNYLERWWMKQSIVALGDILNDSRDIFSSGGFSDIGISGLNLSYLLRDHALEDGDIVQIRISQFGRVIYQGQVNLTNAGEVFDLLVGRGVASLEIFAVNEGFSSPNTAQIAVDNVVRGQGTQTYSLNTGQTATLRIEAGARPGATAPGGAP